MSYTDDLLGALCIIHAGWDEPWEHEIFLTARRTAKRHAQLLYAKKNLELAKNRVKELDKAELEKDCSRL